MWSMGSIRTAMARGIHVLRKSCMFTRQRADKRTLVVAVRKSGVTCLTVLIGRRYTTYDVAIRGQDSFVFPIRDSPLVVVRGRCRAMNGQPALDVADAEGRYVNDMASENSLAGLRVMVIDDSRTIRRTAETLLKKEGCDVLTAVDGFEALAKISDQKPQVIFVDIMMPRLDGYQTCALIKNNQQFRATPVIMLSSKDGLFDKARGRIVGSEQYVTKPFTREELLDAIRKHVTA